MPKTNEQVICLALTENRRAERMLDQLQQASGKMEECVLATRCLPWHKHCLAVVTLTFETEYFFFSIRCFSFSVVKAWHSRWDNLVLKKAKALHWSKIRVSVHTYSVQIPFHKLSLSIFLWSSMNVRVRQKKITTHRWKNMSDYIQAQYLLHNIYPKCVQVRECEREKKKFTENLRVCMTKRSQFRCWKRKSRL